MCGGGEVPELALARSERFVRLLSGPLVEQPAWAGLAELQGVNIGWNKVQASCTVQGPRKAKEVGLFHEWCEQKPDKALTSR